jgi:hypothetical protein
MPDASKRGGTAPAARLRRLAILLLGALAAGLLTDWARSDRVLFPRPLPKFTTEPAGK